MTAAAPAPAATADELLDRAAAADRAARSAEANRAEAAERDYAALVRRLHADALEPTDTPDALAELLERAGRDRATLRADLERLDAVAHAARAARGLAAAEAEAARTELERLKLDAERARLLREIEARATEVRQRAVAAAAQLPRAREAWARVLLTIPRDIAAEVRSAHYALQAAQARAGDYLRLKASDHAEPLRGLREAEVARLRGSVGSASWEQLRAAVDTAAEQLERARSEALDAAGDAITFTPPAAT